MSGGDHNQARPAPPDWFADVPVSGDQLDLDAIEARANAAGAAPWSYPGIESVAGGLLYDETRTIAQIVWDNPGDHDGSIVRFLPWSEADANGEFIAHARKDVPALVAEVRRLRAERDRLSDRLEDEVMRRLRGTPWHE